jgi:hypothetical protein
MPVDQPAANLFAGMEDQGDTDLATFKQQLIDHLSQKFGEAFQTTAQASANVLLQQQAVQKDLDNINNAKQEIEAESMRIRDSLDRAQEADGNARAIMDALRNATGQEAQYAILAKHTEALEKRAETGGSPKASKSHVKMVRLTRTTCTVQDFGRFERQARLVATLNDWTPQSTVLNVLGNIVGPASDSIKALSQDIKQYASLTDFFRTLKRKFVTESYASIARVKFFSTIQSHKEELGVFHGRLHGVWMDAFSELEEPWCYDQNIIPPVGYDREKPGHRSQKLIEQFLQALAARSMRDYLREYASFHGEFTDYDTILTIALKRESTLKMNDYNHMLRSCHEKMQPRHRMLEEPGARRPQYRQQYYRPPPEPMDIGLARRGRSKSRKRFPFKGGKKKKQSRSRPRARSAPRMFYCKLHKTSSHDNATCRSQKGRKKISFSSKPRRSHSAHAKWGKSRSKSRDRKTRDKSHDKCHHCHRGGHWARECPEKAATATHYVTSAEYDAWAQSPPENSRKE